MVVMIVSGGSIDAEFAAGFMNEYAADRVIAVDRGLDFFCVCGIRPDLIVGDFDSVSARAREMFLENGDIPVRTFPAEKDQTDIELALTFALEMDADTIYILGGTGSRLDHTLGTIQAVYAAMQKGACVWMVDPHNWLTILMHGMRLRREKLQGRYVSLIPYTETVEGLTLQGFKYPLTDYCMTRTGISGVSNEVLADEADIDFRSGVLILVMAKD